MPKRVASHGVMRKHKLIEPQKIVQERIRSLAEEVEILTM
jgi:hypothetical protein